MTEAEVVMLVKILEGAYHKEFSEDSIKVYVAMLKDIPFNLAQQAASNLIKSSKWLPSISELREEALKLANPLPTVDQAYYEARMAARNFSPYSGPGGEHFSHPLIKQAVDIVGLQTIGYSDEPTIVAAQFRQVYNRLLDSETSRRKQSPGLNPPSEVNSLMFAAKKALDQKWAVKDEKGGAA